MREKTQLTRTLYIIGVYVLILGVIDPLEGSVIILGGNALIVISLFMTNDYQRKHFLASLIMIAVGVGFMFYLSSLGGFGKEGPLSWWWATLIIPYPAGWLFAIGLLITRMVNKRKEKKLGKSGNLPNSIPS